MDKASGAIYEPSNDFVEVSEAFALRIKELMKDVRHKDSFEFKGTEKKAEDKPTHEEVNLKVEVKDLPAKQSKAKR